MCMYEIITGELPFTLPAVQVGYLVAQEMKRPELPETCDPFMRELIITCWAPVSEDRPRSAALVRKLADQLSMCKPHNIRVPTRHR